MDSLNAKITDMQKYIQEHSNLLLGQQNQMSNIVYNEKNRLLEKQSSIDNAYSSQQRAAYLNNNLQKQYNAFNKILVVILIGASLLFVLALFNPYLTFLPSFFTPIIYIIVISTVIIYSLVIYFDIRNHDPLNYDKLYFKQMISTTSNEDNSGSDLSDNSSNELTCSNQGCCTEDSTTWDPDTAKCIIKKTNVDPAKSGFTNITPNHPYEYGDYSKY
jgi:hypothetical protein